jgi:hypothetical protein
MLIQGLTAPARSADGNNPYLRTGKDNDLIVSELHGRYYETTYRGKGFSVASQAVATTTVGLATTYTRLCLVNPTKSNVNLALNKCSMMQSVIQATQVEAFTIALEFNSTVEVTLTTPATPQSNLIGSGAVSQAQLG